MVHMVIGWIWIIAVSIVLLALAVLAVMRTYYLNESLFRGIAEMLRDIVGRGRWG